jgi:hypothetical protein
MTPTSIPQTNPSSSHHRDKPPRSDAGASPQEGRSANGRFAKGNPGGPGNPFARQVAAMRQEFFTAVTGEDIAAIARVMIEKAKEGDVAAARIVLQYTLGKPAATVDPDRLDEMEWEQWQREKASADSDKVWMGMHASTASTIARTIVPVMQKEHFAEIYHQLQEREEERLEDESDEWEEDDDPQPATSAKPQAANRRAETPAKAPPAPSVSPIETQKAEQDGQQATPESTEAAALRILQLLDATVNKRAETVGRAANDFMDRERHDAEAHERRNGGV